MPMNRRAFFGRLLASTAGLLIAPEALLWRPTPADLALPLVASGALLTLEDITRMVAQQMSRALPAMAWVPDYRKLPGEPRFGVDMEAPTAVGREGLSREYVDPLVYLLAREARFRKVTRFADLDLPSGELRACVARAGAVSVRGMTFWHIKDQQHVLRFDVAAG